MSNVTHLISARRGKRKPMAAPIRRPYQQQDLTIAVCIFLDGAFAGLLLAATVWL